MEEGPAAVVTQVEPSWREAEETDTSDEEVNAIAWPLVWVCAVT